MSSNSEKELMRKKRKMSYSSCEAANNIRWLPREVVRDIAARLPVKSLLRFKAVSKWWRSLISDSSFVDQHHANAIANISKHPSFAVFIETRDVLDDHHARLITYLINHDDRVSTSCMQIQHTIEHRIRSRNNYPWFSCSRYFSYFRGIFMLGIDSFSLWNPSLGETKDIPISPMGSKENPSLYFKAAGLGYDLSTNRLKVVMAWTGIKTMKQIIIEVYDVETSSWTRPRISIDDDNGCWTNSFRGYGYGVTLANGSVCWGSKDKIVCFDVGRSKLMEVPLPPVMRGVYYRVMDMGGCLGLANQVSRTTDDIWIMKEFGVKESWTKLMDIPSSGWPRRRRPICFAKNGEVLVSMEHDNGGSDCFGYLEDRIKLPVRVWEDRGCTSYVESLVSLYTQNHGTN